MQDRFSINGLIGDLQARLLLGWLLQLLLLLGAGLLLQQYNQTIEMQFDQGIVNILIDKQAPWFAELMSISTYLGDGTFTAMIYLALMLWAWSRKDKSKMLLVTAVMIGTAILIWIAKGAIYIPRPEFIVHGEGSSGSSYPSSHVSAALSWIAAVFLIVPKRWKYFVALLGAALIFVVATSRISLGVHRPSDVLITIICLSAWLAWIQYSVYRVQGINQTQSSQAVDTENAYS